jgi:hypothetical protein
MRDEAIVEHNRKAAEELAKKMSGPGDKTLPGAPVQNGSQDSAPAGEKH